MMDIACDACGKRYRIDDTKMKADTAKVKCKACGRVIQVTRPQAAKDEPAEFDLGLPPLPEAPAEAPAAPAQEEPPEEGFGPPPAAVERKVRFGLFGKTLIVMLLVSLLPFGLFWFLTFRQMDDHIRSDSEALMAQTAKGMVDQIDAWVNSNGALLRMAAALPEIAAMNREQQEPVLKAIHQAYPFMYLVFTVDAAGMNVARNDNQPLVSYADRHYFKEIMAGRALSWQSVVGRTSKVPALVLAVPIRQGNRVVGVMAAAMTVDDVSKTIATWKKGATGFAFLVDEQGYVVAHPQKKFAEARENLNATPLISAFRSKGWTSNTAAFIGENGRPVIGHARSTSTGWVLAVQQEESEILATMTMIERFVLALLAATVLLVVAVAWFSARSLVTPIMKLTDAAERMSLGDLNVKVAVESRDEIGLLAQAIGRMQTSLQIAMRRLRRQR
ncbi:MAG: zinc-ribbon domain-containing protein [Desulfobacterales bacterium]|jgi:methyl-accepting chemotaxis protein|nr:zinc-ribbon domain-containing protein [Desulfobacterales bacterium]